MRFSANPLLSAGLFCIRIDNTPSQESQSLSLEEQLALIHGEDSGQLILGSSQHTTHSDEEQEQEEAEEMR
jgi:hypothetical protein